MCFLDSFKIACILFVIMLIELQKISHQEIKCLCGKTAAVRSGEPYQKDGRLLFFVVLKISMLIINVYIYIYTYIHIYIYTLDIYSIAPHVH
jgi:hypothetical protein